MESSGTGCSTPVINVHNTTGGCILVRSPSRDSVTTQASLGSVLDCSGAGVKPPSHLRVSFRAKSECHGGAGGVSSRGPSPLPGHRLSVPSGKTRPSSAHSDRVPVGPGQEVWLDEGNDLIRSCGALSKVLGLQRSFSCGDIVSLESAPPLASLTRSDSWLLSAECDFSWAGARLDANSRSLSTWVAVGDVEEVNSQLPSPHVEMSKGFPSGDQHNQWTAADLIRSVNKKVRHNYIRRRLKVTYKALEQLSESGFDLVKVEAVVKKTQHSQNLESLLVTNNGIPSAKPSSTCPIETVTRELATKDAKMKRVAIVSPKEIAKDQGKPLSKYERNMMIFDWLHTLDESAPETSETGEKETQKNIEKVAEVK